MTAGRFALVAAGVALLAVLWWWDRRAARAWDRHIAQAQAQARHPSRRTVPACACDNPARPAWHGRQRCVPLVDCQCRGACSEPMRHHPRLCQPLRETA